MRKLKQNLGGKYIIDLKVTDRTQLFSSYSFNDDNLNPELRDYILTHAKHSLTKDQIKIHIHTHENSFRTAEVAQCIHHHFHIAYESAKKEIRRNTLITLIMLAAGILAMVCQSFAIDLVDNFYLTETLNVAAWVFVWEAVDTFFLQRHSVTKECLILRKLAFALVEITDDDQLPLTPDFI